MNNTTKVKIQEIQYKLDTNKNLSLDEYLLVSKALTFYKEYYELLTVLGHLVFWSIAFGVFLFLISIWGA